MIGALILILLGALFLLINFDVVSWNVFLELWRFWPLLLVLGGLRLVVGKDPIGRIIVGLLGLVAVLYVLATGLYISSPSLRPTLEPIAPYLPISGETEFDGLTDNVKKSVDASEGAGVSSRSIDAKIGAAKFSLTDDHSRANPLAVESPDSAPAELTSRRRGDDLLEIKLETPSFFHMFGMGERTYEAVIGQVAVPTSLNLDVGASELVTDLDEVKLTDFTIDLGAGSGNINLGESSIPEKMTIDVGAGSLSLVLPKETTVIYDYSVGAGHVDIEGDTAVIGDHSGKLEGAGAVLELSIDVGAGSVNIERQI